MNRRTHRSVAGRVSLGITAAALLGASGCGAPNRHRIVTGDLTARAPGKSTLELAPRIDVGGIGGPSPSAPVLDAETARGGVGSIEVSSGAPEGARFVVTDEPAAGAGSTASDALSGRVVGQVMIDSVVGQINGKPVFASEFFSPIDARLSAEARTKAPAEWIQSAQKQIRDRLRDEVRDELLLAEFESSLTVEQRSGLLYWVSQLRENLVSESRGSEELLSRKLREEEGLTIDEKVEAERRAEFIQEQFRRILRDKAYVAWRDVVLQYRQDEAVYQPAPTAHLRMISVSESDPGAVDRVTAALGAGEDFAEVASRESGFNRAGGGAYDIELTGEDYASSRIFNPEPLNEAAVGLRPGGVAGPIAYGSGRLAWIRLDSIETSETSLYEAQLAIRDALVHQRLLEEQEKYFQSLVNRSSLSPIQDMERRLLDIASTRYLIDGTQ
ncbi:MAG: peptidyl-prolyl cis-trans isomerase [Phycisphaeraceae bacterium]|nr:peptidyl-prolyl cis-trans isomerase [Phycisphaeraceae bacterium]MCB9848104.1 peptidyl-prolyl cis-trans isomerase [Phycisphaeraceae bacterium]